MSESIAERLFAKCPHLRHSRKEISAALREAYNLGLEDRRLDNMARARQAAPSPPTIRSHAHDRPGSSRDPQSPRVMRHFGNRGT